MKKVKNYKGELEVAIRVPYKECECCGASWYICPVCGVKIFIDTIGIQSCKNCGQVLEVI